MRIKKTIQISITFDATNKLGMYESGAYLEYGVYEISQIADKERRFMQCTSSWEIVSSLTTYRDPSRVMNW